MYKALVQQPTIYRPVWRKGVHYFDVAFDHDLDWYRGHFPLQAQLDRSSRRHDTRALCFESSPYYLFHPLAGERIAASLPDVKMLILVRDPVERAYSAHAHELARGFETPALRGRARRRGRASRGRGGAAAGRSRPTRASRTATRPTASEASMRRRSRRWRRSWARSRSRSWTATASSRPPAAVYSDVLEWLGVKPVRSAVFDQYNGRPRLDDAGSPCGRTLDEHFVPFDDQLTPWLGARAELANMSAEAPSACGAVVLFLGGLSRSGTTVLERLLDREPADPGAGRGRPPVAAVGEGQRDLRMRRCASTTVRSGHVWGRRRSAAGTASTSIGS